MASKIVFFSLVNPPVVVKEDYTDIPSLTDPSQNEPIAVIVRKILSGSVRVPPSDMEFDTDNVDGIKDIDEFMTANESLRPGYVDVADAQVYAELSKETIARLKRDSEAGKSVKVSVPLKSQKDDSTESQSRSNEDLNGTGS